MNYLHLYLTTLALLLAASCSKEESAGQGTLRETRICLSFSGEAATRGELDSNDAGLHDITTAYLYIFEGTTADAPCIARHDIGWQAGTPTREYWISHYLKPNTAYTYIAAGWDSASGEVYTLPNAVEAGTTLGKAVARLAPQQGKDRMAASQIYAGQCVREIRPNELSVRVNITMRRKMAGVLAYFESVPYKVNEQVVDQVRVRLHTAQNTVVPLWHDTALADVFGSAPLEGDDGVLLSWDMSGYTHNDDIYTSAPVVNASGQTVQLENTLLAGAFLLPVAQSAAAPTLCIELCNASGDVLKTFDVRHNNRLQFDLRENCYYSMGTKLSANTIEGDRPIPLSGKYVDIHLANIAQWDEIVSNQGFESIQGVARILTDINPEKYIFDATCRTLDIFIKQGTPQKQWSLSVVYDPYVDAQGITQPAGNPAFKDAAQDDLRDWIHIADTDAEGNITGYVNQKIQADGSSQVVRIVVNDYVVQRNLTNGTGPVTAADNGTRITDPKVAALFKNDIRTAYLKISTEGGAPLYYRIRQYNALTIHTDYTDKESDKSIFNPDPNPYRAVARLDYGWKYDENTGLPVHAQAPDEGQTDPANIRWGFFKSATVVYADFNGPIIKAYMSCDDGQMNTRAMMRKCEGSRSNNIKLAYPGCAVRRLQVPFTEIRTNENLVVEDTNTGLHIDKQYWYLPAGNEMLGIAKNFEDDAAGAAALDLFGIEANSDYWTSTDHESNIHKAHFVTATAHATLNTARKEEYKRTRRMRHFGKVN